VTLVNFRAYWRFLVVLRRFLPLIIAYWRDRKRFFLFGGSREVDEATQRERADVLLDTLLTLGPTFIKLGQLLSTRPDVLPPAYIEVLEGLQDDVPPAPWEESKRVLEAEIGPVDETFDDFDTESISGASLGQVYTATYEGDPVAIKVRRPGIEELVEADLRAIRWSLPLVRRFIGGGRAFSLENPLRRVREDDPRGDGTTDASGRCWRRSAATSPATTVSGSRPPTRRCPARGCSRWSTSAGRRSAGSTNWTTRDLTGARSRGRSRMSTSR